MTDDLTQNAYLPLAEAYAHFNRELFEKQCRNPLPACLITLQRRHGSYGFFAAERFAHSASPLEAVDEIALNPRHFWGRDPMAILATLAQEMVTAWQHPWGKPGRAGYHNREWSLCMLRIDLIPSDTDQPGGQQTGQRMTCSVEAGGVFEHACRAFLERGEVVFYHDRASEEGAMPRTSRKTRYFCPNCQLRAWAKAGVSLRCEKCDRKLLATVSKRAPASNLVGKAEIAG